MFSYKATHIYLNATLEISQQKVHFMALFA